MKKEHSFLTDSNKKEKTRYEGYSSMIENNIILPATERQKLRSVNLKKAVDNSMEQNNNEFI